jgi:thiopeptide-type bacteriocin biosynthesis protein
MKPAPVAEGKKPKSKDASSAQSLLYIPLDSVMVRAPLLPIQSYFDLADDKRQLALLSDPKIQQAIAVASPSLLGAMERYQTSGLTERDADRMRAKLLRYQIRMSTRPTPFGLFAGVGIAKWGDTTDIKIKTTCAKTQTRPDMAWLMKLVFEAESDPAIRKRLRFVANVSAVVEAGRVTLSERAPTSDGMRGAMVSVRATGVVRRALTLAQTPIHHDDLVAQMRETTPSASEEKVEKLLGELWEQTLLLTDLRPPLTHDDPAAYVADRLAAIPEASAFTTRVQAMLGATANWDDEAGKKDTAVFSKLLAATGEQKDDSVPVQVDMAMSTEGRVGRNIGEEAAHAAELLLRLTPFPYGLSSVASYRQAFLNRYGHEREVALLELLDPHRGLGPISGHGHANVGPDPAKAAARYRTLLRLATDALHDRRHTVTLDEKLLAELETWKPNYETAPLSLDVNVLVSARSSADIDNGDFKVIVGPNLGAQAAGRNLGRFAHLLSPEGRAALDQIAIAEQSHASDHVWAEIVYLPPNLRSANVVVRPPIRKYEVVLGATAGVPPDCTIPPQELVVGVTDGRFYVRWLREDKKLVFTAGHMLNLANAPALARFLSDVSSDGKSLLSSFDWGPAEGFPFLPRVESGRVVLRPAEWRLQKGDLQSESEQGFRRELDRWRAQWEVPRFVCLSFGDNRLVLDLEQELQANELKSELAKLREGGFLVVQEVLPSLEEAWLPGSDGQFYSEFIVPLLLTPKGAVSKPTENREVESQCPVEITSPVPSSIEARPVVASRWRAPGSEWLFAKLFCPRNLEDDVICDSMFTLAENAVACQFADSWFFIRYADPEPHIRLRFHGRAEVLTHQLFGHVCDWANRLMADGLCLKLQFDTYEQEVERFGGAKGMAIAESIFAADSRSAIRIMHHLRAKLWPHDQTTLIALSIDNLLRALALSSRDRLNWYKKQANPGGQDVGTEYRKRKDVLRPALAEPARLFAGYENGAALASIFDEHRVAISSAAQCLRELSDTGELQQPLDSLFSSFVHLHVNRLGALNALPEQTILSLLLRVRESLEKAPITHSDGVSGGSAH